MRAASHTIVTSAIVGGDAFISEADDVGEVLPAGLGVVGVFTVTVGKGQASVGEEGRRVLSERATLLSQVQGGEPGAASPCVVAVVNEGGVSVGVGSVGGAVQPVDPEVQDRWLSEVAMLRVHTSLSWAPDAEGVDAAFAGLERDLCSQSTAFATAAAPRTPPGAKRSTGPPESVFTASSSSSPSCAALGGGGDAPTELTLLALQSAAPRVGESPVVQFARGGGAGSGGGGGGGAVGRVDIDLVCYAPASLPVHEAVGSLLIPGLKRQVRAMRANLAAAPSSPSSVRAVHFKPEGWSHVVSAVYVLPCGPTTAEDEQALQPKRRSLHRRLGLPLDRPVLRLSCAVRFCQDGQVPLATARLQNVHVGLSPSPVTGGEVSLVFGTYEYFHYMQDRFDDNGWGCAYRSLQTIVSWFRLQHYTTVPVPSHREIQQLLVGIGDKPAAFVGSSQWIGAIELGLILDALLGVTYKVMALSSGADIPTKGRELAQHFRTQGTPIMIGGGLLAYTLLGVDFNERTGDVAFLILDPHYTGGEDLRTIQGQRWVGWKRGPTADGPGDIFDRNSFYNLLMPQRPVQI